MVKISSAVLDISRGKKEKEKEKIKIE